MTTLSHIATRAAVAVFSASGPTVPMKRYGWRTPLLVVVAGCLIAMIGFGIRSTFGLFLEPMALDKTWGRETFALAFAVQNLLWGIGVPIAGALADRFGPIKVLGGGAVAYAIGIWGMADATTPFGLQIFGGVVTGLGVAFTSFSLALAAMAKVVTPQRRPLVLGIGASAGSFGQVVFSPMSQAFISSYGWNTALLISAGIVLLVLPLAMILPQGAAAKPEESQSMRHALREAVGHRGFGLLTLGFFVCGFHVAFIAVHLPTYVRDIGLAPEVGAYAMAVLGLFNILGAAVGGVAGQRFGMKSTLSVIYALRGVVIFGLLLAPSAEWVIYGFSAIMGLFWLSTVPLTTGIVAQVFGVQYLGTLFGIVFLSHQLGAFLGVWLGGRIYDQTGSYDLMWWTSLLLAFAAAVVHWPINEQPIERDLPKDEALASA